MLKHRRENRIIPVLHCWRCHSYTGPNHHAVRDGGAVCGQCGDKNPLGNMVRLPVILITQPLTIPLSFTRSGTSAQGTHPDLSRAIGPWVRFQSGDVLEKAITYLGSSKEQVDCYRDIMRRWGQGTCEITIQPHRKNLLRLDYTSCCDLSVVAMKNKS